MNAVSLTSLFYFVEREVSGGEQYAKIIRDPIEP